MGVRGFVAAVFDFDQPVVYECRACGTTLDAEDVTCPYCGPTDVVEYDLGE